MTSLEKNLFLAANLLVGGTGLVYGWFRYFVTSDDPYAVVNHPAQPLWHHLHLWTAPLLVFAFGHFSLHSSRFLTHPEIRPMAAKAKKLVGNMIIAQSGGPTVVINQSLSARCSKRASTRKSRRSTAPCTASRASSRKT
jgi:hypothetical protein